MKDLPTHSSQTASKCLAPGATASAAARQIVGLGEQALPICLETRPASGWDRWEVRQAHIQPSTVPTLPFQGAGEDRSGWATLVRYPQSGCFPLSRPWPGCGAYIPSPFPRPNALVLGWVGDVRLWEHEVIPLSCSQGVPDRPRVALCGGQAE